jgi:DNA-binding transcriptional ArsR family regulator
VFEIIAEPNRRAILSLLVSSEQSVGEIERQLGMPQTSVSKHLRVLREAGFVESTVDAQRHLDQMDEAAPAKGKTTRKGRGVNRERNKGETK